MRLSRAVAALALGAVLAYVSIGQSLGERFPVSPLSMFAERRGVAVGRVVVRARGRWREIDRHRGFRCEPIDFDRCRLGRHPENDARAAQQVQQRRLRGRGEPVEIVRRSWQVGADGRIEETACVLARCEARR